MLGMTQEQVDRMRQTLIDSGDIVKGKDGKLRMSPEYDRLGR